jgi:hypothetical protein
MSTVIGYEFVEDIPVPNEANRYVAKYLDLAEVLRNNPGQIIKLTERKSTSFISSINQGALKAFKPKGEFKAVGRMQGKDGLQDCYIQFVGTSSHTSEDTNYLKVVSDAIAATNLVDPEYAEDDAYEKPEWDYDQPEIVK